MVPPHFYQKDKKVEKLDLVRKSHISPIEKEHEDTDMIENPYQKAITKINIKDENKVDQMINWSIFSDKLRYVDSSINETSKLTIRPLKESKQR